MHLGAVTLLTIALQLCDANLEGPFLFFGPKSLEQYKRTALKYLGQDDLMKIYCGQAAIVVFNNQDSVPLSSGNFPRLRKMLEGQSTLILPQDFLDVHPDYISNNTQVLTLQGPWSERDAQMTETFARLQDIYGAGRVLGVLGNSISQSHRADYVDRKWNRLKRDVVDYSSSTQVSLTVEDDKSAKPLMKHALYNATGPPGKAALLYSSGWPELQWPDGTVTILDTPIGEPTIKPTRLYTILVVRFADGDNTRDKITLEFSFKQLAGWWSAAGVEARRGRGPGLGLLPPVGAAAPSAVLGRAYHCPEPLIYSSENATLIFPDIMMQPFMENTQKFADAFDCFGFISGPICSGLLTTLISLIGLALSIYMLLNIQGLEHFENVRSKPLPITVSE